MRMLYRWEFTEREGCFRVGHLEREAACFGFTKFGFTKTEAKTQVT